MTRRASALARAFKGRWRIVEMDVWDNDDLDLAEPAHITFEGDNGGSFAFVAVTGQMDVRYGARDGSACAEFSWEGRPRLGRSWNRRPPRRAHLHPQRR
jgi:hypothetical protein